MSKAEMRHGHRKSLEVPTYTSAALSRRAVQQLPVEKASKAKGSRTGDGFVKSKVRLERARTSEPLTILEPLPDKAFRRARARTGAQSAEPQFPKSGCQNMSRKCPPGCPCRLTHQLPRIQNRTDPSQNANFFADWIEAARRARARYMTKFSEKDGNIEGVHSTLGALRSDDGPAPMAERHDRHLPSVPCTEEMNSPVSGVREEVQGEKGNTLVNTDSLQNLAEVTGMPPSSMLSPTSVQPFVEDVRPPQHRLRLLSMPDFKSTKDLNKDMALNSATSQAQVEQLLSISPSWKGVTSQQSTCLTPKTKAKAGQQFPPVLALGPGFPVTVAPRRRSTFSRQLRPKSHSLVSRPSFGNLPTFKDIGIDDSSTIIRLEGRTDLLAPEKVAILAAGFAGHKVRHLDISFLNLGLHGVDTLQPAFKHLDSLEYLVSTNNRLNAFGATSLGHMVSSITSLRMLELGENEIGSKGMKAMLDGIRQLSGLQGLGLAGNRILDEGVCYLADTLRQARIDSHIVHIARRSSLPSNSEDALHRASSGHHDDSVHSYESGHRESGHRGSVHGALGNRRISFGLGLTSLNLRRNGVGPAGCVELFQAMIPFYTQIHRLDLSENPITLSGSDFSGVAALREGLREMTSLCSLNLASTKLNTEGGVMVMEGLTHKEKTMQVQIRGMWRQIGLNHQMLLLERRELETEVQALEASLRKYNVERSLTELNLDNNVLSMEGMKAFGESRGLFPSLTSLHVGSNELTGNAYNATFDGVNTFAESLKTAKHLTFLNFSDNRISSEAGDQTCLPILCESLFLLQRLTHLDLSMNNMGMAGCKFFAGPLASLRNLRFLDLHSNRIESQGMKDLVPALLGTLTDLNLSHNDIGPDGVASLTNQIPALTNLTRLDLSLNRLSHAFSNHAQQHGDPALVTTDKKSPVLGMGGRQVRTRQKAFGFKDVASKMSISGGEVRKLALMATDFEGGPKRGFTLFAQACGQHLASISTVVISATIDAGAVRNTGPSLDLSAGNYEQEDFIIIAEMLKNNPRLTAVDVSKNDLTSRGADLRGAEVLSEWLLQAPQLLKLDMSYAQLHDGGAMRVAKGLLMVTSLEELKLKGNQLSATGVMALSSGIQYLSSLTHLDLSDNSLGAHESKVDSSDVKEGMASFAIALSSCVHLRTLDMRDCALGNEGASAIASALGGLTVLKHLHLSGNLILDEGQEDIGVAMRQCKQVEVADDIQMPAQDGEEGVTWSLSGKVMTVYQVSFISNCIRRAQFVSLDISGNQLGKNSSSMHDLADSIGCLSGLQDLNLSDNGPFSVEVCRTLALSLRHMTTLRALRLTDNGIHGDGAAALMCTIVRLAKLKDLDIRNNRFQAFPVALPYCCPDLLRLEVSNNPWLCPSQQVMSRNPFQIREHLTALFMQGTMDRELALALVGLQFVGKTSLCLALTSNSHRAKHIDINDRTKGCGFAQWVPNGAAGPSFSIYDLAGMPLYRDMQRRLLLPRRALYCLVWRPFKPTMLEEGVVYRVRQRGDLERDKVRWMLAEQVNGWLDELFERVPGCSVMLVGTHTDEMDEDEILWQSHEVENAARARLNKLRNNKPDLQPLKLLLNADGSMPTVSCKSGHGIDALQKTIVAAATALPFYGEILPRSWMMVREHILTTRVTQRQVGVDELQAQKESGNGKGEPPIEFGAVSVTISHWAQTESPLSVSTDIGSGGSGGLMASSSISSASLLSSIHKVHPHGQSVSSSELHSELQMNQRGSTTSSFHDRSIDSKPTSPQSSESPMHGHTAGYEDAPHIGFQGPGDSRIPSLAGGTSSGLQGGDNGGYMWIGHLKRLCKECGVEDSHAIALLRYLHDSGLVRCFAFEETSESWQRGNETYGGFEELDPYRSAGFKLATNSRQTLMGKKPPEGVREQAWWNVLDTVVVDVPWLTQLVTSVIHHEPMRMVHTVRASKRQEVDPKQMEQAAMALHTGGTLRWGRTKGYGLLRELWTGFMPDHDMRRMRNLLEGRGIFSHTQEGTFVPALKDQARGLGSPHQNGQCTVFLSSDVIPSVVNNKEQNMSRAMSALLLQMFSEIMGLQVESSKRASSERVSSERETHDAVSACGVFIMVVTDSYFRSRACRTELTLALALSVPIVPIILPQYSLWPPAIKDGCWWEDNGIVGIEMLSLCDPVDLSLEHFTSLLSTLLETEPVESRQPSIVSETSRTSQRWGVLDSETPPSTAPDLEATAPLFQNPTPPSTASPRKDAPPVMATVSDLLSHLKERVLVGLEEEKSGGGEKDVEEAGQAAIEKAFTQLCEAVEGVLGTVGSLAHQNTWFPTAMVPKEMDRHYRWCVTAMEEWDKARIAAREAVGEEKALRVQREEERRGREEEEKRNVVEELEASRVNAELWQRDPLHAKLAILHTVANIQRGLGVAPRWNEKDEIVARAQEMATNPEVFVMKRQQSLREITLKHLDSSRERSASSGEMAEQEGRFNGDDESAGREGGDGESEGGEDPLDGVLEQAMELEGGLIALSEEAEEVARKEDYEPLFDMILQQRQRGEEGTLEDEDDELSEGSLTPDSQPDYSLTLGMEQHEQMPSAVRLDAVDLPDSAAAQISEAAA